MKGNCLLFLVLSTLLFSTQCVSLNEEIPDEKWSYVNVRESAHMFWWFYGAETSPRASKPLVMWLQGGPGGSSTGFGNFAELGPLDVELKPRNTSWTKVANVLFVDNPVGTGFSYVTNNAAYTKNVQEIAEDLLTLFKSFMKEMPIFQTIPFFIFCESYGGKMTSAFGVRLHNAISSGEISCNFKGVALGDSWISPVDSVLTWGPYLYSVSLLDKVSLGQVNSVAEATAKAVQMGQYVNATDLWSKTEDVISSCTDNVDVYNILLHNAPSPMSLLGDTAIGRLYATHVGRLHGNSLTDLMNGPIRKKLGVIPKNVTWGGQSGDVFLYQKEDFMKPVIDDVSTLLKNYKVVVFQGQLDMICDTLGAEKWIEKINWEYLPEFLQAPRVPLYPPSGVKTKNTGAFLKRYGSLELYYILKAGHMVPADAGEMALEMVRRVVTGQ